MSPRIQTLAQVGVACALFGAADALAHRIELPHPKTAISDAFPDDFVDTLVHKGTPCRDPEAEDCADWCRSHLQADHWKCDSGEPDVPRATCCDVWSADCFLHAEPGTNANQACVGPWGEVFMPAMVPACRDPASGDCANFCSHKDHKVSWDCDATDPTVHRASCCDVWSVECFFMADPEMNHDHPCSACNGTPYQEESPIEDFLLLRILKRLISRFSHRGHHSSRRHHSGHHSGHGSYRYAHHGLDQVSYRHAQGSFGDSGNYSFGDSGN